MQFPDYSYLFPSDKSIYTFNKLDTVLIEAEGVEKKIISKSLHKQHV
jgi:hypothetical protein